MSKENNNNLKWGQHLKFRTRTMKTIKCTTRFGGKKYDYFVEVEDNIEIVRNGHGWTPTRNGKLIGNYYYLTKAAAAESVGNIIG